MCKITFNSPNGFGNMESLIYPENLNLDCLKAFFTYKNANLESILPNKSLYMPDQRHTDEVVILDKNYKISIADGLITDRRGIFIGVKVADCLPILLYAKDKKVIGAVHSGWRGTAKGILKKALLKMIDSFKVETSEILISIGPSIRGCCYEVGDEVIEALREETEGDSFIISGNGKRKVDLVLANIIQAKRVGIPLDNIWYSDLCTCCNSKIFASYRKEGKVVGRQYGVIGML